MTIRNAVIILCSASMIAGCTVAEQQQAKDIGAKVVVAGQLFCAKATPTGPLIVALATAVGVPVVVTGATSESVQIACAVIGGIPVSPPVELTTVPVVAANVQVVVKP